MMQKILLFRAVIPKCCTFNDFEWLFHFKLCICACKYSTILCGFRKWLHKTSNHRPILSVAKVA